MHSHDIETLVREKEPNICQISVWKDGREIYSGEWNGYRKKDCTHIIFLKSLIYLNNTHLERIA